MTDRLAVILAGGAGRRIGGDKPQRRLNGQRLVDLAIAQTAAWNLRTALAVRRAGQVPDTGIEQIVDADIDGPLGGVIAALEWAQANKAQSVLLVPCDMPNLPSDLPSRLGAEMAATGHPATAGSCGRCHPVCALWPTACLDRVRHYARAGGRSLRGALEMCAATCVDWSNRPVDPFENINTMAALEAVAAARVAVERAKPFN